MLLVTIKIFKKGNLHIIDDMHSFLDIEFFIVGDQKYIIVKLNGKICFIDGYRYPSGHKLYVGIGEKFYIKIDDIPMCIYFEEN